MLYPCTYCLPGLSGIYRNGRRKELTLVLGYYFSVGTLLSLTLHLWSEEVESRIKGICVHIVMHILLIADAVYLYSLSPERSLTEISIAHGAAILALWLSVFFLSFIKEKNDIPSWNFASYTVGPLSRQTWWD